MSASVKNTNFNSQEQKYLLLQLLVFKGFKQEAGLLGLDKLQSLGINCSIEEVVHFAVGWISAVLHQKVM